MIITYLYPVKILSRLDFPAPDGPIMAHNSPDRILPLTFFKITLSSEKEKNCINIKVSP